MKRSLTALVGVVCVLTIVATLLTKPAVAQGVLKPVMSFIVNDAANPVPVAVQGTLNVAPQGLGPQKASDLVTVQTEITSCSGGFGGARRIDQQLNSDGTNTTFAIPTGKVFVISNVEFILISNASQNIEVRLGIPCGAGCMQPVVDSMVSTDSGGKGATNLAFTNGIAIKPGVELCVADVNHSSPNAFATLHGYFASDK
jgi:hypothetical protein